ncbi:glucuronate isomerase [Halococcus hamelinensis]|uniref:Uronate isomerase n=1 Tax=Halococcus hamelinensis 100A6 TaxID=1132509 RepID=M0LVX3_9EURY|nr:glucuronate isomerase [Halococcus hamelinensis]EMA37313.1 glucuronate isomerase [Halococcus hamelinensis 100A6]
MAFLDEEYLLETETARELYETIRGLPILDPHSHADVAEIVANEGWDDIWEVEGATDHYVWAAMRKRGVPENRITGAASNREKWNALAGVFPELAGNPTYEWIHLDLKRRFGIEKPVSAETADEIWAETAAQLEEDSMRPQALLREMNVEVVCSTDDPTSSLDLHDRASREVDGVDVLPTWRADRAVHIDHRDWDDFIGDLDAATDDDDVSGFDGFLDALAATHDRFAEHGCRASDLSVREPVSRSVSEPRAKEIYETKRRGEALSERQVRDFKAFMLEYIGSLNVEKGWVTQLHIGPVRDYRDELFEELGSAAGGTVTTGDIEIAENLRYFLNTFDGEGEVVLYCVNPTHYPTLTTIARAFPNVSVGPAWWFNDSPVGIEGQLEYVGSVDLLANHAGMVSDSRKLLSFDSRFEMFRRSLANVVGRQVERGRVPMDVARDLVEHVAHDRPMELFGFR